MSEFTETSQGKLIYIGSRKTPLMAGYVTATLNDGSIKRLNVRLDEDGHLLVENDTGEDIVIDQATINLHEVR